MVFLKIYLIGLLIALIIVGAISLLYNMLYGKPLWYELDEALAIALLWPAALCVLLLNIWDTFMFYLKRDGRD